MIDDTIEGVGSVDVNMTIQLHQTLTGLPVPGTPSGESLIEQATLNDIIVVSIPGFGYSSFIVTYDADVLAFLDDDLAHPGPTGWHFFVAAIVGLSTTITVRGLPGPPLDRRLTIRFGAYNVIEGIGSSDTIEPEVLVIGSDSFQDDAFQDDTFQ